MKKRQTKIILNSGISIQFNEKDKVCIVYEANNDDFAVVEIEDIKDIPRLVMNKSGEIIINHSIDNGDYMEYYLTRDKITWAYYSEIEEKEGE